MSIMTRFAGCVGVLALAGGVMAQVGSNCIDTLMNGGNRGDNGGMIYFDLDVGATELTFTDLYVNCNADPGADIDVTIYTLEPGSSYSGNEINFAAWTEVATGVGIGAGVGFPSHVILDKTFALDANTVQGVAIELSHSGASAFGFNYTNGDGTNEEYLNADLRLSAGSATNVPFADPVFSPRVFNGWLFYDGGTAGCTNPPPSLCSVEEIVAMTVPSSRIDMDTVGVGPTNVGALNAAGTPGPADLGLVSLPPKGTAAAGVYDTNVVLGDALAADGGVISIIEAASGTAPFDATTYELTFNSPHTEFGFEVSDWDGPMVVELFAGTTLVGSITTAAAPLVPQFIQIIGDCTFDRVTIDASTTGGNFVLTEIWTQESGGCLCACDFDLSTGPGVCDIFDFLGFQNAFVGGETCACDIDTSTGAGVCDIFDFLAFQNDFVNGCP